MGSRPNAGQQRIRGEVAKLNARDAAGLEVQVQSGNIVPRRRERLTVAKRVNLVTGNRLVLIRLAVLSSTVCAEEHVPTELGVAWIVVIVGEA
jgi:hypothetical protein